MKYKERLEDYQDIVDRCLRCSLCKWVPQVQIKSKEFATICPSIDLYNFHSFSGGGRTIIALSVLQERLKLSKDADDIAELVDIIYKCTECGGCDIACKYLNCLEPVEVIQALRERLVELGLGPLPIHQKYIDSINRLNNPYNESHGSRLAWLPDDVELTPDAKIAYFVGCTASYRRQEIAIATARLLNMAGVKFTILTGEEGEVCCGSPAYRVGDRETFEALAQQNIDAMHARGIKTVITSCAGCYSTIKIEYAKTHKMKFKVMHSAEMFQRLIKKKKLKIKHSLEGIFTYHDPCHLGRGSESYRRWIGREFKLKNVVRIPLPPKPLRCGTHGFYDMPREVLQAIPGVEFREMERIREYSYCCGAGGGVKSAFPEFAIHTAKHRVDEAKSVGADTIVTCCPFCVTNLKDASEQRGDTVRVKDLTEILYESLKKEAD